MKQQSKRTRFNADCRCGRCEKCIDEARWERIFQEKFADPGYYSKQQGHNSSPLVDL